MAFSGFPAEGLAFLAALARNNRREWFQPRKPVYEESVRAPMLELVDTLNAGLARRAPAYVTEPAKAVYRIYRDTRFSADKTPYKTHIAALFTRRGLQKHASAGLYLSVSPKEIEVAGGVYMPTPEELLAIRSHLAERHQEFRRILRDRKLRALMGEMRGESLARSPKGFPADHPAAGLIRGKQWLLFAVLDGKQAASPRLATSPRLAAEIAKRFHAMIPFVEFLNAPLAGQKRRMAVAM